MIRRRTDCLSMSEIITILIWFNNCDMSHFKSFYHSFHELLLIYFPKLPSYKRFINVQKKAFIPMIFFLRYTISLSEKTGVYYIDSTFLQVCKNQRIYRHKTFKNLAQRGYGSTGWLFDFVDLCLTGKHVQGILYSKIS